MTAIEIGGRRFPSKGAARAYFSALRSEYETRWIRGGSGVLVIDDDAHRREILALFAMHPRWPEKRGDGSGRLVYSAHGRLDGLRASGFSLLMRDGTVEDFSYLKCLGVGARPRDEVFAILRASIRPQHQTVLKRARGRSVARTIACEGDGCHALTDDPTVDHTPPFVELVTSFLEWACVSGHDLKTKPGPGGFAREFSSGRDVAGEFAEWHRKKVESGDVVLRVLCRSCNSRKSAR